MKNNFRKKTLGKITAFILVMIIGTTFALANCKAKENGNKSSLLALLALLRNGTGTKVTAPPTEIPTTPFTKQMGVATKDTLGAAIAVDSSGNSYVAGNTNGGLDGNSLTGTYDLFLIKHNSLGSKQWTKQMGVATKVTKGRGVATDSSGNVYVVGDTNGNLDGNPLTGAQDIFVIKYDSSGSKQWVKLTGLATKTTQANAVTTDSNGNIYITGFTNGGLDGNTLTGTNDIFVIKYDSSGSKQWTKQMGVSTRDTYGYGVATDSSGNIYISGYTSGNLDGNTLTGIIDIIVIKFDSSGTKQWTKQMGASVKNSYSQGVVADSSGNVYVGGYTEGGLDGNTVTGTIDAVVIKYDTSGTKQWTKQTGIASKNTYGFGIAIDSSKNIYLTGWTNGNLSGNTLIGTFDVCTIKYDSTGSRLWTKLMGTASQFANGYGIAVDLSGNVYVAGQTNGGLDGNSLTGITDVFVTNKLKQ